MKLTHSYNKVITFYYASNNLEKKSYDFAKKSEMPCGIAIHDKVAALYSRNKVLNQNPQLKFTTLLEKSCIIKIFEIKYFM